MSHQPTFPKVRLLLAQVQRGKGADSITMGRVNAALNLIAQTTERYEVVDPVVQDSVIKQLKEQGKEPTAITIAHQLHVEKMIFVRADRLENILRLSVAISAAPDFKTSKEGSGYALIRFRNEKTSQQLYDPAILAALQRAFAVAEGDSMMFASAKSPLRIFPAPTLVVGGIDFQDKGITPPWRIFDREEKVVLSYATVLDIIRTVLDNPHYVVYDIDTRDSVYALNGLYLIENYRAPSTLELQILERFDIKNYITGSFIRQSNGGAILSISLCTISNGRYTPVKTESMAVREDQRKSLLDAAQALTAKLLPK